MKNGLKLFIATLVACPLIANAAENHVTLNGCNIEDEQYISMKATLTDEQINNLSCDLIEKLKGEENIHVSTQYFDVITYGDRYFNNESIVKEISKDEYYSTADTDNTTTTNPFQTEYKRLLVTTATSSSDRVYINATLTWLKMPKTRSFDVWALRVNSGSIGLQAWETTQNADGTVTTQSGIPSSVVVGSGGYGASIAISSSAKTTLIETLSTTGYATNKPSQLTLTYQHAQHEVSLNESMNWSISSSGYGGVINFKTTAAQNSYDQMKGIVVNLTW